MNVSNLEGISEAEFKSHNINNIFPEQSKKDYILKFESLQKEIAKGRFQKIILSRTKTIQTSFEAVTIFKQLNKKYLNTFNYIISNSEIGTWLGATPELLLSVENDKLKTMSLAGTKTANESWSEKEFEEQELVTNTILNRLKETNCKNILIDGPATIQAGKIEHLHTSFEANLSNKSDWTAVLKSLHPTPAVCGIPTEEAKEYIPTLEDYPREFYTGFIGIINNSRKDFFVNLRCMQLHKEKAKLYVGGGITAQSNCEAEWKETERKAETLGSTLN